MTDEHVCQCKHCGRLLMTPQVTIKPAPEPPPCEHEWQGISVWGATDGNHGSRRCLKCHLYQQW